MLRIIENVGVVDHFDLPGLLPNFGDGFLDGHVCRNAHITGVHQRTRLIFGIRRRWATVPITFGNDCDFDV